MIDLRVRVAAAVVFASALALSTAAESSAQTDAANVRVVDIDTSEYPDVSVTLDVPGGVDPSTDALVVEDGEELAAQLQAGARGGLEVVLVIDTSGSMKGAAMDAAKIAAATFVNQIPAATRVAVVGFGSTPYVVSPMSSDKSTLTAGIGGLQASGDTALYDALNVAADLFSAAEVPRSIILVSDGGDTASTTPLDAMTTRLSTSKMRLFAVRLVTEETNDTVLQGLAGATNGQTIDAGDTATMATTYGAIASAALQQVRVTYRSKGHDSTPIVVELHSGGTVRAASTTLSLPAPPDVAEVAPPPAAPAPDPEPGDRRLLIVGGVSLFAGLALLIHRLVARPPRSLLAGSSRGRGVDVADVKRTLGEALEQLLERLGRRAALGTRLENAGLALRPGEYLGGAGTAAGLAGFIGLVLGGLGVAILFVLAVALIAWVLLTSRTSKRRADLERQLPDFLQQLTSSLRAGYGLMQAIDAVAREVHPPMSQELRRVVNEVQLGRELTESLEAMAARVGGQDFGWVVQAIEINHEVGGDLVEVLDAVATTIRARSHLRRQIKTLSAQGRLSSRILLAMPFVLAGVLSLLNPGYLAVLFEPGAGPVLIVVGAILMVVGWTWLRRIVRLQF